MIISLFQKTGLENFKTNYMKNIIDLKEVLKNKRFVVYDFETNGLWIIGNRPIQFACVVIEGGKITHTENFYIKCDRPLSITIEQLTGITDEILEKQGIDIKDAFQRIDKIMNVPDTILVGHNIIMFDNKFLNFFMEKFGFKTYPKDSCFDTYGAYKARLKNEKIKEGETMGEFHRRCACSNNNNNGLRFRLEDACGFYKIEQAGSHNAVDDVGANANLFIKMLNEINDVRYNNPDKPEEVELNYVSKPINKQKLNEIKNKPIIKKITEDEKNQNELKRLMYLYYCCFHELAIKKQKEEFPDMFHPKDVLKLFQQYHPEIKNIKELIAVLDKIVKTAENCKWNDALWKFDEEYYMFDTVWMILAQTSDFGS